MSKSEHDNFDLDMNHYSVHDLLELFSFTLKNVKKFF